MQNEISLKQVAILSGLALFATLSALAFWKTRLLDPFRNAFVFLDQTQPQLQVPDFWSAAALFALASITAAFLVQHLGARRAFPYLGTAFLALAIISLLLSRLFVWDLLFLPMTLGISVSAVAVQLHRLWASDRELSEKMLLAANRISPLQEIETRGRLMSGLKLLDTVLSLDEAIVFQFDHDRKLTPAARLKTSSTGSLVGSRNSTWRGGIELCERALKTNGITTDLDKSGELATSVALPLRHEALTSGALLIRLRSEFDENDRALLSAVGAQIARNLQRDETAKSAASRSPLGCFSHTSVERQFETLYVLNGLLTEQRFGIRALNEISDGVAIAYLDGTLAYANQVLLGLANLNDPRLSSLDLFTLLDCFRTDVFDEPAIAVRRVLQTGEAYQRELQFDSGETYGLSISLLTNDLPEVTGQPLCLAIQVRDLTNIKEYEQLKSDMISLMSHELRTPLTSINGFAELLTADPDLPEQAREFVGIIASESQRLSRMINTFLAVTKLQRKDKQEVLKIPLRLDEVVRDTISNLQPVAKKRRIRLVEQPAQRIPPVAADKSLITQALKNLVSNAIKYSPERTTVTVSTALEAEAVRVCVEDRGYGIPTEAKDRVWEKFYRVVREGQEKDDESTGLGLAFVREVVEQHGGSVELDSEEGRGSRFSFTLPRL